MKTTKIKIEKNVPIPSKKGNVTRGSKYPFSEMKLKDSFLIKEKSDKKKNLVASSVFTCFKNFAKTNKSKMKITTRRVKEGVRVWRIK